MSKQPEVPGAVEPVVFCCSPVTRQPLSAEEAGELARVFKAVGDPVRLRLLSLGCWP